MQALRQAILVELRIASLSKDALISLIKDRIETAKFMHANARLSPTDYPAWVLNNIKDSDILRTIDSLLAQGILRKLGSRLALNADHPHFDAHPPP